MKFRVLVWLEDDPGVSRAVLEMEWAQFARMVEEEGKQVGVPLYFALDPQGRLVLFPRPEQGGD